MTESLDLNTAKVDVLDTVAAWRAEGREIALATVVRTWGSSPRPVGSQLAVDRAGGDDARVPARAACALPPRAPLCPHARRFDGRPAV